LNNNIANLQNFKTDMRLKVSIHDKIEHHEPSMRAYKSPDVSNQDSTKYEQFLEDVLHNQYLVQNFINKDCMHL